MGSTEARRPTLVLLTRRYPFGIGEEFLTVELEVLSRSFRVHLVPVSGPLPDPKQLPEGALVHTLRDDGLLQALLAGLHAFRPAQLAKDLLGCVQAALRNRRPSAILVPAVRALGEHVIAALLWGRISRCRECSRSEVHYAYWGSSGAVALSLHRAGQFVVRMHGYDLYPEQSRGRHIPCQARIVEAAKAVLCVSKHGRDSLAIRYPALREKLALSRLGVRGQDRIMKDHDTGLHVGSISAVVPVKRLHLIAESIAMLRARGVDARWSHFGLGPDMARLEDAVDRLGLAPHVQFRGHLQPAEEGLYPALASSGLHVVCNVSSSEGIPVSLMEATSFGIPVVATNVGGSSELVGPAKGTLLPQDPTIEEIADALEFYARLAPAESNTVSLQTQQAQRTLFDGEKNAEKLARFLADMVGSDA